jgi:NADH dehydrogenase
MKQIVIIGGGFAGTWAALTAAREIDGHEQDIRITLVARDEYLVVRPRLYEIFAEGLRAPLRPVVEPVGIKLHIGNVTAIDVAERSVRVTADDGSESTHGYDRLVLAGGSEQRPLPVPGAADYAFNIDTFAAARSFDEHLRGVLRAPERPGNLTFVIVGAGFTGVELATEMRNRIRVHSDADTANKATVVLIERENVVGPDLGANPRPIVLDALRAANVTTMLSTSVEKVEADSITLTSGERIATATVVVTAGLQANPLTQQLHADLDPLGRVIVNEDLRVNGRTDVFAAGDVAHAQADANHAALMSCQHAIPMGKYAGFNAAHDLLGTPLRPYSQPYYVTCLDLGESGALLTQGWERTPEQSGAEAKQLKQKINTQWIYPPTGQRATIIAAADLDAPWPPPVAD